MPRDATRLEVNIGNASDRNADLDLYLIAPSGALIASSTNGGARESLNVKNPAPGYYLIYIAGTDIPSGSTTFDVQDTLFSTSLGSVTVDSAEPVHLTPGESLRIRGRMVADIAPPAGRRLVGRFSLATDAGTALGGADVLLGRVTQPQAEVTGSFGPALGFSLDDRGRVSGSQQVAGVTRPVRWAPGSGVTLLANPGTGTGYALAQSPSQGYATGQLTVAKQTRAILWNAEGELTPLPLPGWEAYTYARGFAVTDEGTVIGNATGLVRNPATGRDQTVNDGYIWNAKDGYRKLAHLTDNRSLTEPLAVNDAGVVVGHSSKDGRRHAVRWDADGRITDLGTLPGMTDSFARSVNSSGTVAGSSGDDAFVLKPGGTMTRLPDFGFDAEAKQVNDAGWIIGTAETAPDVTTAVVWNPEGRMHDLGSMVDSSHWSPMEGIGIHARGEVAFYAMDLKDAGKTKIVVAGLPG
ncbi:pre-peptidase C-terminal domain-containing protein [Streptomyces sp. NPDC017254]|uniref:pre-peptidase C-terminal domain-containing protein n=1 Tax=unclassified Streptomyces TaxID=2593676 RepID=UPI00379C2CF6